MSPASSGATETSPPGGPAVNVFMKNDSPPKDREALHETPLGAGLNVNAGGLLRSSRPASAFIASFGARVMVALAKDGECQIWICMGQT